MPRAKAVIVTGAGRGIGAACARDLAGRGAQVVVNDRDPESAGETVAAIRAAGGEAVAQAGDIADEATAEALVAACLSAFGRVDGLVNNAALYRPARLLDLDGDAMRTLLSVNVLGTALCTRAAARAMRDRGGGSIVNVSSGASLGYVGQSAYAASKGAINALTWTWALELAAHGIRVNAVMPRAFTAMSQIQAEFLTAQGETVAFSGRGDLSPGSNAPTIAFLLSDAARDVTGQILRIDGRTLGLLQQPVLLTPRDEREDWTLRAVAAAFDTDLGAALSPFGIASLRTRPAGTE